MEAMGVLWCFKCASNLVRKEGDVCRQCTPSREGTVVFVDFSKINRPNSLNSCSITHCVSTIFGKVKETPRTILWECAECHWPMKTNKSLSLLKSSPKPMVKRCRRCDSEVVAGVRKNGRVRTSWVCHTCSYTTRDSHIPFRSDQYRVWMSRGGQLSFHSFKRQQWNQIPFSRRREILAGINVSDQYVANLQEFLIKIRGD